MDPIQNASDFLAAVAADSVMPEEAIDTPPTSPKGLSAKTACVQQGDEEEETEPECVCAVAPVIPGINATGLSMVCPVRPCGTVIDPNTTGFVVVRDAPVDPGFYIGLPSLTDMEPLEPCVKAEELDLELQVCTKQVQKTKMNQQVATETEDEKKECELLHSMTAVLGNRVTVRNLTRRMIRVRSADGTFDSRECDSFVLPNATSHFMFTPIGWVVFH